MSRLMGHFYRTTRVIVHLCIIEKVDAQRRGLCANLNAPFLVYVNFNGN